MKNTLALKDFTILIVDDTYNNILLIRMLLEEHGVTKIFEARSAKEAFKLVDDNSIDAILLDVMMPEVDGITACRTWRSDPINDLIPIIMVTANDDNVTLTQSYKAGADDFIAKPVNETILVTRLLSQLQKVQLQKEILQKSRFSAMDEMTSMLAHQWRQPLSLINSVSSRLRTQIMLDVLNNDDANQGLESIEGYVSDLSELITSFKANFSSVATECTSVEALFNESLSQVETTLGNSLIEIIKVPTMLKVNTQAKTVSKVILNLLTNAIEVLIRDDITLAPTVKLECIEHKDTFSIIVTDNANGIQEKDLAYIYEPYFSTKEEKNGVGLGLFFVKIQLDNELNGTIKTQRIDDKTVFTVTLPKSLC